MPCDVRQARLGDVDVVLSIWQERPGADSDSDRTNQTAHRCDFKERIGEQDSIFQFWVATSADTCLGWSSLQRMRSSPSLKDTMAEWSIYVTAASRAQAVGSALAAATIAHARQSGLEWIFGFVAATNVPCISLFERCGFDRVGKLPVPKANPRRPEVIVFALDVS